MKTCPKCNRTFPDEGQKFCTFDGGLLIAPQTFDPNATIRATSIDLNASERPTSRDLPDPNATMVENYPATVALPRNTGPTGYPTTNTPDTAEFPAQPPPPAQVSQPPVQPPSPPPPQPPLSVASPPPPAPVPGAEVVSPLPPRQTSAPLPGATVQQPAPSAPLPQAAAPKKKSKAPWIILGIVLFLLLGGGALAGVFFFVVKPVLDKKVAEERARENPQVVVTSTPTPEPSLAQASPSPSASADTFVPPPNTVEFTNAKDKLDGPLAAHYFDFSFYYPNSWQADPKAGVPGATNFVKVERRIPPDFTQENFVVKWYESTGTYAGDLPSFPKRAEEFSASLAKAFPEYKKVSEGPTKVNSMDAYEFKWEGLSKGTEKGDLHLWGRVIFLPTGHEGDTNGAILSMFTTSLAPELSSVEDVGTRGEAPVILESFRFGKK
ncbi:MAG TPA: hypothetical protein VGK82_05825 [Pyrinomonadaceae bacterium]